MILKETEELRHLKIGILKIPQESVTKKLWRKRGKKIEKEVLEVNLYKLSKSETGGTKECKESIKDQKDQRQKLL